MLHLERLVVGGFISDCKKPCLTTTVSISESSVGKHSMPDHSIFFTFPSKIQTTVIKEDSFGLMESLNFLGSNLGLWPGLGLFQLLEGVIGIIVALKPFEKCKILFAHIK